MTVSDELLEIEKFCNEYSELRGLDPDRVYGLHRGHTKACELRISGLRSILDYVRELEEIVVLLLGVDGSEDYDDLVAKSAQAVESHLGSPISDELHARVCISIGPHLKTLMDVVRR